MMTSRTTIVQEGASVVNVASIPQRSPFRYPGGKTWFVPHIRRWLGSLARKPRILVEPFAGGAIVGLSVAAERLAGRVVFGELDDQVAAVWSTILSDDCDWLIERILAFGMTREAAESALAIEPESSREKAFQTILRNRVQRGGILARGATLVRNGENGKGVSSRWYPQTLARRILDIASMKERLTFVEGDAFSLIDCYRKQNSAAFFIDPPYTAGGKSAGSRLYSHSIVDHPKLFSMLALAKGPVLMTYDDSTEVRRLADRHGFQVEEVPMKNTHHQVMHELVISNFGSCLNRFGEERIARRIRHRFEQGKFTRPVPRLFE